MEKAIFKLNNGRGALLCSHCAVIIKTGNQFSIQEWEAAGGHITLPPKYCDECKNQCPHIRTEGASCSLNNNCIFPKCLI